MRLADTESRILAKQIRLKCEQYWNENGLCDEEVHAILEWIHVRAYELESGKKVDEQCE